MIIYHFEGHMSGERAPLWSAAVLGSSLCEKLWKAWCWCISLIRIDVWRKQNKNAQRFFFILFYFYFYFFSLVFFSFLDVLFAVLDDYFERWDGDNDDYNSSDDREKPPPATQHQPRSAPPHRIYRNIKCPSMPVVTSTHTTEVAAKCQGWDNGGTL